MIIERYIEKLENQKINLMAQPTQDEPTRELAVSIIAASRCRQKKGCRIAQDRAANLASMLLRNGATAARAIEEAANMAIKMTPPEHKTHVVYLPIRRSFRPS